MENRSNAIRALSDDECDSASGGVGWFVAIAVWAGAAALGVGAAILTAFEEEVLVPTIELPS